MPEKSPPPRGYPLIHGHIFIKYFFIVFLYFTSFREPESRVQCGLRGGLYGQLVNIIWEINHVSVGFVSTSYGIRINKLWERGQVQFSIIHLWIKCRFFRWISIAIACNFCFHCHYGWVKIYPQALKWILKHSCQLLKRLKNAPV